MVDGLATTHEQLAAAIAERVELIEQAADRTVADVAAGAPVLSRVAELFELATQRPARFSNRRWADRLRGALDRADRAADFGAGREGAGAELLVRSIVADVRAELAPLPGQQPEPMRAASLAYYVPAIEKEARSWRRAARRRRQRDRYARQSTSTNQ